MIPLSSTRWASVIFSVALVTLASQVLFHRIISAKLLNNYAFLVIALTMLGFAGSGVVLSRHFSRWLDRLSELIPVWAALFVFSSIAVTLFFYQSPVGSQQFYARAEFIENLARTLPYALLFALPFFFSGLLMGSILAHPRLSSPKMYCWDLVGSAIGAILVIPMIGKFGVERAMLGLDVALLLVITAVMRPSKLSIHAITGLAAMLALGALFFERQLFVMRYPDGSMLAKSYTNPTEYEIEGTYWDPVARIEISKIPPPVVEKMVYPSLMGDNPQFLATLKRMITQNNFAFTMAPEYDGDARSLDGIKDTIYAGAYLPATVPNPKVAVIGVGGGFDVLTALAFEARDVTGIEVNAATLRILNVDYASYFKPWVSDPRVRLVRDDGRHYLAGSDEQFDVIQLSGVDTYTGSPGAAHVFSENYLYTLEAFQLYFSKLTHAGVLNLMRLEHNPPREMFKALATAVTALRAEGVAEPARHIAMLGARNGNFVALLLKKTPFELTEVDRLVVWSEANEYTHLLAAPFFTPEVKNAFGIFLGLNDPVRENHTYEKVWHFDIAPTTDNRPFFFQFSRWSHLFTSDPFEKRTVPVMQITLSMLFIVIGLLAVICVAWPLQRLKREGLSQLLRQPWRFGVIFAGTAIAFLAVEMALLQRFGLFLGHPNYALSVVLAGLLFTTGLGALFSTSLSKRIGGPRFIAYLLAVVIILECAVVFPALHRWQVESMFIRAGAVIVLIAPLGALMGTFVPLALDRLKRSSPAAVPWAWGVNGIFSVMAPILSIAFSMTWGIDALLLVAIPIYLVVGACLAEPKVERTSDSSKSRPLVVQS